MEEISFKEVLDVCAKFVASNGESIEELNDLFQKLLKEMGMFLCQKFFGIQNLSFKK